MHCKRELVPAFSSSHSINNKFPSHLFTPFSMSSQVSKTRRRTSTRIERFVFLFPRSHVPIFVSLLSSVRPGYVTRVFAPFDVSLSLFFFFSLACVCFCLGVRIVFWDRVLLQRFWVLLFL
jgi:hypothetical protein